ncbi:MAG: nicotinate-nicotinamide nucleotide adenylyltransferase [Myxococcota bacterium]
MQIAIYGGSFNPPHVAHGMVASWLKWTGQVDEVWMVPVYHHAFEGRQDKTLAAYEQRLELCERMCQDLGSGVARVSDVESRLPAPSYTIDTLRHLAQAHPEHRFRLVVGADVLPQRDAWRDWSGIERDFSPIIVGRDGYDNPPDVVVFPGVSSTDIRARLHDGRPFEHLVTARVAAVLRAGWAT